MPEDDSASKWKKVIFIVVGILLLIVILITLFVGIEGLGQFFTWLIGIVLFLGILFALLYVFYLIFLKKYYKDIPANYRKKLQATAKMMKNEMLGTLWLSGDYKHNRIELGKYAYLRMMLPKATRKTIKDAKTGKLITESEEEVTEEIPIDCFMVIKKGVFDKLFGSPIFVLVKPEDHNQSSIFGDTILNGFNLIPLDSQFHTLNHRNLDVDLHRGMAGNYMKMLVYELFSDLDRLVRMSINLDQQHRKEKEKGLEFQVPQMPQLEK